MCRLTGDMCTDLANTQLLYLLNLQKGKQKQLTKRKCVKFADMCGLPLVQTREYADVNVEVLLSKVDSASNVSVTSTPTLQICFTQPSLNPSHYANVEVQHVRLDSVAVHKHHTILGTVLVHNICFHKHVFIRYSNNCWITSTDTPCHYDTPITPQIDRFTFSLHLHDKVRVDSVIEFCVCYRVSDNEIWDNNLSRNYKVICVEGARTKARSPGSVASPGRRTPHTPPRSPAPYW